MAEDGERKERPLRREHGIDQDPLLIDLDEQRRAAEKVDSHLAREE
jgi:hypothetical protein